MKVLNWLDRNLEKIILSFLVAAIVVVMLFQIVMRYCFNISLPWTEELCRFCYVYFMFIGTAFSVKEKNHLRVDAVVGALPKKAADIIQILVDLVILAMLIYMFIYSFPMLQVMKASKNYSAGLKLPLYIVYSSVPIGFGLTILRYVQLYWKRFTGKEEKQ